MQMQEHDGLFMDWVQTLAILLNGAVLSYVVIRLERAFGIASDRFRSVLTHQQEMLDSLNTIWKRINHIETRIGMKSEQIPADELRATLSKIQERLDDIESKKRW